MHQIHTLPLWVLALLLNINLGSLPDIKDVSRPKALLPYPYVGTRKKYMGGECHSPARKSYKGKSNYTGENYDMYLWRNQTSADTKDTSTNENLDLRFRQALEPLRCPESKKAIAAPEDSLAETCIPYVFGTYVGFYTNPTSAGYPWSGSDYVARCDDDLCAIVNGKFGATCKTTVGISRLPCPNICEHNHWKCDPNKLFLKSHYKSYRHFLITDPYEPEMKIRNFQNAPTETNTPEKSNVQRIILKDGIRKSIALSQCSEEEYRNQTPAYDVGCISEDAMRIFIYHKRGETLVTYKKTTAYGRECKGNDTTPAVCMFNATGKEIPSCHTGAHKEPCYKICHHALITCVPPFGPAYSEAQDTLIALSRSPREFQAYAQTYIGTKTTTYNGKRCQAPSFTTQNHIVGCTNQPIINLPANQTFKSHPFFPYCFTEGPNIQPCFPVCRKHDSQLNHIRHLGYRTRKELETIESKASQQGVPPFILFPSRRKEEGYEVFCGTKMQYAHLFKQLPGNVECFNEYPIGFEKLNTTQLYHDLLNLEGFTYVDTEGKYQLTHNVCVKHTDVALTVDREYPGCRPKHNSMASYSGTTARTIHGYKCERWQDVKMHNFRDHHFPDGSVRHANNYCRNPDKSPCGPWCYYKIGNKLKREPCFNTCVEMQNETYVACRPGPVLQWSDNNMFRIEPSSKTRTGRPCVAKPSVQYAHNYRSYRKAPICLEDESHSYIGPMCYINATTREPCYYACEHRNLLCIDRDHMLNIEYNGPKNTSVYGLPCLQWTYVMSFLKEGQFNYQWKWIFEDTRASALPHLFSKPIQHNQCLNILTLLKDQASYYKFPGMDPVILKGPICFVNEQDFIVPQPCFLTCEDMSIEENNCIERATIQTTVYTGFRNTTKTRTGCLRWDERYSRSNLPWEITGPLHNYCRNYGDSELGPWCYVFDKGVERKACFDVCPENKTLVRHKEADHNWQYGACIQHSDCCQDVETIIEAPTEEKYSEILSQLDKIWPDPSKEIREIMLRQDEDEEKENKLIMYFGIYAVSHLFVCICWIWWINRGPDPEKERENLEVEEEKERLKEVAESLAKKTKTPRRRPTGSFSDSGKSKSREWFSGFRRSRTPALGPSQSVGQRNF